MKPSILIIGMEGPMREILASSFSERYEISFVPDVPNALKLAQKKVFDLCLLEGSFTGKKGMEGLKQICRQKAAMDIVAIVPSGRTDKGLEAVRLGAYDYVLKPDSTLEMAQLFERIFGKRALERENRFWRQELMALFAGRESLTREDIPSEYLGKSLETPKSGREEPLSSLKRSRLQFERQCVRKALERAQGNQTLAAKSLGLHRNTLIWKLKELRLEAECRRIVRKRRGK